MGKAELLLAKPGAYGRPSLSPDGQRLALEVADGTGTDIWIYDFKTGAIEDITKTRFGPRARAMASRPF